MAAWVEKLNGDSKIPRTLRPPTAVDKLAINQLPVEDLRGKRVFVRLDTGADESAPVAAVDDRKLRDALPTLRYLVEHNARVVIGTHLGDPRGKPLDGLRVDPVAERLSLMMGKSIRKLDEAVGGAIVGAVTEMSDGAIVVLENLRFYPGEDGNDDAFARELARLCDVYCNDAFAIAHRTWASMVAITRHVRPSTAGLALSRDLVILGQLLDDPKPPFVGLIAGVRIEEKLPVLEHLLPRLDRLFIGGALALIFLRAEGYDVGAARVEEDLLPLAESFMSRAEQNVEVILPPDLMVVDAGQFKLFEATGHHLPIPKPRGVLNYEILPSELPVDIGPSTIRRVKQLIGGAHTVFWNGPMGIAELEPFAAGTREVAQGLLNARHSQLSVTCGDSLTRAVRSFGLPSGQMPYMISGGEAALELLGGKPLPAVAALDDRSDLLTRARKRPHKILAAVDGSGSSLDAAGRIGRLIDAEGAEIILLYVHKPKEVEFQLAVAAADAKARQRAERRMEAERILTAANAVLARQGLVAHRRIIAEGDPAGEILKWADEMGVDLIVMGSHGRTGVLRFFLGSVSRKVLDQARCPALIVRAVEESREEG